MRRHYASAQKSIALLTIVGTFMGSHGSTSRRTSNSQLRVRSMTSVHLGVRECKHSDFLKPALGSSAATATGLCARGGGIDDDHRRRRDYERDELPPRRSSPSYNGYDREKRGPDRRNGPRQQPGVRDQRYSRHDLENFDDKSHHRNRESRGDRGSSYDERDGRNGNLSKRQPSSGRSKPESSGRSKKWFNLKKDKPELSPNNNGSKNDEQTEFDPQSNDFPNPPPPPPPLGDPTIASSGLNINPAETQRTPIHYNFPTAQAAAEERKFSDDKIDDEMLMKDAPEIPFLNEEEDEFPDRDGPMGRRRRRRVDDEDDERYRASPRRDAVTIFMSTRRGAMKVRLGSMIVGAALGGFIGKSLMNDHLKMSIVLASLLLVTGFLRNDYGELSRALGLAFVFTLQRTGSVRKDYPTLPHLKAMIRQGPRKPFPPVEDGGSAWKYEPIYRDDPEFKMTYALLAMALVGSFCGGNVNVPMLPAWIGGIVGALAFASLTTGANARGDLGRSMGMRIVGLVQLVLSINSDLRILGKGATVGGLIFDKIMIMDRKHRIKDRIVIISKWGYDKVSRTAVQVKEDMQDERPERR